MPENKIISSPEYLEAYNGLNDQQREAVDAIQGPVAVVAGPGTGKTQIISTRIGRILSAPETQAAPYNILCLTFTDAGAIAMRERLVKLIGPDAHKVHVFTYHAFCNQIIQQHPERFGLREWKPISEIESIELAQELIAGIKPGSQLYSTAADRSYLGTGLRAFFELFKKENWDAEGLKAKIAAHLTGFKNQEQFYFKRAYTHKETGEKFAAGDFNQPKYDKLFADEQRKMKRLSEAIDLYPRYNELLAERQRFDYQDMIRWVIEAFGNDEALLLRYKEQYLYFLVDEFQDSNGAQLRLLDLLTHDPDGQPNLFVVGDTDQAIYRFQGAEAENLERHKAKYEGSLKSISLEHNYRSGGHILQAAARLISQNHNGQEFLLKASNPAFSETPQKVNILACFNQAHEETVVLEAIKTLRAEGKSLNEIAVIFRNHSQATRLIQLLQTESIPFRTARPVNILELPLVRQMTTILKYVAEELRGPGYGEYLLFEIMHYDFIGVHPMDAARFSRTCAYGKDKSPIAWCELLGSQERIFQLGLGSAASFKKLNELIGALMKAFANNTLQELFGELVHRGGILAWAMHQPDRSWWMEVINTLFDFIKEETARNPALTLEGLLHLMGKMVEYKVPLQAMRIFHAEEGVELLTAHSAKGLEFEHVFLLGANSSQWERKRARGGFFSMPATIERQGEGVAEEDERRLFYVAMTRAKKQLTISYSGQDLNGKPLEKSQFLDEIIGLEAVETNNVQVGEEAMMAFAQAMVTPVEMPPMPLIDKDLIKEALKGFRLSVTHLNKYLRCPVAYYFENILRVPFARSASMGFGSAIHYALEMFYKDMQAAGSNTFGTLGQLQSYFAKSMKFYRSHFTDATFDQFMERGNYALEHFLREKVLNSTPIVVLEYRSNHLAIEGVPVSGMLDKIEFDGNKATVVDYKTGKYEYAEGKLTGPTEKNPEGGDYWRQMVFYKLLIDNERSKDWKMVAGRFEFVEPTKEGEFKVGEFNSITAEEERLVRAQITDTYAKIQDMVFEPGCGEPDCQWCGFVKTNYSLPLEGGNEFD